ncbi:MAG: hypothetical protein FD180_4964 [Planctomycetota bacterium]|nr:MAG: hypothetical protein FD180_4964 [Planctomycetota bacterium]
MFQSITRHAITGEAVIRGTQIPVEFVIDMMREGYEFESIAKVLIDDHESDALEAMHCALLFPEAVLGSRN